MINRTDRKNLPLQPDATRTTLVQASRAAQKKILSAVPPPFHRVHIRFTETVFFPRIRTGNPAPR